MTKRLTLAAALLLILSTITSTESDRGRVVARGVTADTVGRMVLSTTDSLKALEKLAADLSGLIKLPEAKAGNVGIEIRSLSTDKTFFSMNADKPLTPASTTKIVTTFTALSELGAGYAVRTVVAADLRPRDGVVKGNLYVKGYGDPFFSINEIDQLVDQLLAAGIKHVEGNIVGDGSFFDDKTERTEYSGDDDVVVPLPPIAALTIERSVFTVVVSSPRTPGAPCNVQTYPPSSGFAISNQATVSAAPAPRVRKGGKRRSDLLVPEDSHAPRYGDESIEAYEIYRQRKPAKTPPAETAKGKKGVQKKTEPQKSATVKNSRQQAAPTKTKQAPAKNKTAAATKPQGKTAAKPATKPVAKTATKTAAPPPAKATSKAATAPAVAKGGGPVRVSIGSGENGRQTITVAGSLPPNRTVSYRYTMRNPPLVIAGMIYDRLRSHGITIAGSPSSGITPARMTVLAETGRPLQEILGMVMKNSNNFLAEYVFKMIGGAAGGQQETAQKTVERIHQRMTLNKIPFGRCIINDGSGLSRANCLSASALTGILGAAYNDQKIYSPFYQSMSVAGVDGTLRKRMKGTYAEGNVHGKTGTLRNVSALAGYVTTRDGEQICFSMLMNGGNHGAYRALQDKIAARLANFSYGDILVAETK